MELPARSGYRHIASMKAGHDQVTFRAGFMCGSPYTAYNDPPLAERGVGRDLGVGVGLGAGVGRAVGVGVGVVVGLGVGVGVGVCVEMSSQVSLKYPLLSSPPKRITPFKAAS